MQMQIALAGLPILISIAVIVFSITSVIKKRKIVSAMTDELHAAYPDHFEKMSLLEDIIDTRGMFGPWCDHDSSWYELEKELKVLQLPIHTYRGVRNGIFFGSPEYWKWIYDEDGIWRMYLRNDANGSITEYAIPISMGHPIFGDDADSALFELAQ